MLLKNLEAEHKNNRNSQHAKFFQNFLQFLFLDQKELFVHDVEAVFFQIRIKRLNQPVILERLQEQRGQIRLT